MMRAGWLRGAWAGAAAMLALAGCATAPEPGAAAAIEPMPESPLAFMFGEWRGTASVEGRGGQMIALTQTERVGPMVGGDATVMEGRGYGPGGDLQFNAFAVVSKSPAGGWEMRSYQGGNAGTFPFEPKADGFVWSTPAGPHAVMRYTATFAGDRWDQIGEYVPAEGAPRKTFEMHLTRIGPSDWPRAGYVEMK
jgi:hypothetical protein